MLTKTAILKKLPSGKYRLYSKKKDSHGKRRNLGTFDSLSAAKKHESDIHFFKSHSEDGATDDNQTKTLKRLSAAATFLDEIGFKTPADKIYAAMDCIDPSLKDDINEDYIVDMFVNTDEQMNVGGPNGSPGCGPQYDGSAGSSPSLLSMDVPSRGYSILVGLIKIANALDQKGLYEEADVIDVLVSKVRKSASTDLCHFCGLPVLYEELVHLKHGKAAHVECFRQKRREALEKENDTDDDLLKTITDLEKVQESKKTQRVEPDDKEKQGNDAIATSNGRDGTSVTDNQGSGGFQGWSEQYMYHTTGDLEGPYGPAN